jgi:hypothetical protein
MRISLRLCAALLGAVALAGLYTAAGTPAMDKDRPQPLHIDGRFHTLLVPPTADCPLPFLLVNGSGEARGSVIGRATATATECSDPVIQPGTFVVHGKGVFTTHNGDQLFLEYFETSNAPDFSVPNPVLFDSGHFVVQGGTGRFEGATGGGHIEAVVTISFANGVFSADVVAEYDGTITLDERPAKPDKPAKPPKPGKP